MLASPASPCINVCRMDPHSGLCTGCYRTLEEIAGWSRQDAASRWKILGQVAERRQQAGEVGELQS